MATGHPRAIYTRPGSHKDFAHQLFNLTDKVKIADLSGCARSSRITLGLLTVPSVHNVCSGASALQYRYLDQLRARTTVHPEDDSLSLAQEFADQVSDRVTLLNAPIGNS